MATVEFNSDLLIKGKTLTILPVILELVVTKDSIIPLLVSVFDSEKEKGNIEPYINPEIWDSAYFKGKTVPAILEEFKSTIYRSVGVVGQGTTCGAILSEAEKTGIKKIYTYTEALIIVLAGILSGEINENNAGITAYFMIEEDGLLFHFRAQRVNEDKQLLLDVHVANHNNYFFFCGGSYFN